MRLVGSGHAAIRATHHKTLEFTRDVDITERATCVVAVAMEELPAPMAGDVRITIRAGGESCTFEARASSSWQPAGTAVLRRSPFRLPDTFATHAGAAAADLPRPLVAALQDPATTVEVDVEPVRGRACVVLFAIDSDRPDDRRLRTELAAADLVVAEDEDAARLVGERVAHGPVEVPGRVLVLAARELPGQTVIGALRDVDVETVGLPAALAAAAASPSRAPILLAVEDADARDLLRDAPAATRLVVPVTADEVWPTLRRAAEQRGTHAGVFVQGTAPPVRVRAAEPVELPSREAGYLCLDATTESTALDPRVKAAINMLLADDVPTKVAARALAELTGWPKRQAYEYLLSVANAP